MDSYIDLLAYDGMRNSLASEFSKIYLVDLGGDVYKNPELSGTTHNVFGIKLRVVIVILVKKTDKDVHEERRHFLRQHGEDLELEQKCAQLESWRDATKMEWKKLQPDSIQNWLTEGMRDEYAELLPLFLWHPKPCEKAIFESTVPRSLNKSG